DRLAEPLTRQRPRRAIDLDRVHLPELAEHRHVVAGAEADFQDPRVPGQPDAPPDQAVENVAPGHIPPMLLVQLRHIVVDAAVHQANTQKRLSEKVTSGVTNRMGMSGHHHGPASMLGAVRMNTNNALRARLTRLTAKKRLVVRAVLSRMPWPRKLQRLCRT